MGTNRASTFYTGKSCMASHRSRVREQYDQDAIEEYFERATRKSQQRTAMRVLIHESPQRALGVRTSTAKPIAAVSSESIRPERSRTEGVTPFEPKIANHPGRTTDKGIPPKPIPMLRPRRAFESRKHRFDFSIVRLGYGLAVGTAAGLAAVWLIDIVVL